MWNDHLKVGCTVYKPGQRCRFAPNLLNFLFTLNCLSLEKMVLCLKHCPLALPKSETFFVPQNCPFSAHWPNPLCPQPYCHITPSHSWLNSSLLSNRRQHQTLPCTGPHPACAHPASPMGSHTVDWMAPIPYMSTFWFFQSAYRVMKPLDYFTSLVSFLQPMASSMTDIHTNPFANFLPSHAQMLPSNLCGNFLRTMCPLESVYEWAGASSPP